jgi:hypothetical protein
VSTLAEVRAVDGTARERAAEIADRVELENPNPQSEIRNPKLI